MTNPAKALASTPSPTSRVSRTCGQGHGLPAGQRGAAMLAALCFATVLAIALGSYMTVCYRTLALSSRGMESTRSIELAETGMEDALWALNKNDWSTWTISGTTATKSLTGFSFDGGVTGSVSLRVTNYDGGIANTIRTVTVTGTTVQADGTSVSRTLTSSSAQAALFVNAIAATSGVVKFTSAGTSSIVDSYDSSAGLYSAQTPGYSAVIASGSTSTSSTVQLTNAQVKGYVATLSTGPSYSTSAKLVGPLTPSTTKIDTSRLSTSPYQPIFTIKTPSSSGATLSLSNGSTSIGTAGATTPTIYYTTDFDLQGGQRVTVNGPVQIVITGSGHFYVGQHGGGSPSIDVTSTGTLEIFAPGDIAICGNGISNQTQDPKRVAIYGSSTLTTLEMNTAATFYGVIYSPNADFKVTSNNAIYGAIVARNVTFAGTAPVFHYDVNLRNAVFSGIDTPYAVSNWRESTAD